MRRRRWAGALIVVLPLVVYLLLLHQYRRERCPYEVKEPGGRYALRVCYRGAHKWLPQPEGYVVYAELYSNGGTLLERRTVADGVDAFEDVAKDLSQARWDAGTEAFVDNAGREILRPLPKR